MAENSKIEWTRHTSLEGSPEVQPILMGDDVARIAKRHAISHITTSIRIERKFSNVVRLKVSPSLVSAKTTAKIVSREDHRAPRLVGVRSAIVLVSRRRTVLPSVVCIAALRRSSRRLADTSLCLGRMPCAQAVRVALPCRAHLSAALGRHLLPLHWRNECRTALQPSFLDDFAWAQFRSVVHG